MDLGLRRHMESLAAQIRETGSTIRLRGKLSEAERRQGTGGTQQALGRRGLNGDLPMNAHNSKHGVHQYVLQKLMGKPSPLQEKHMKEKLKRKSDRIKSLLGISRDSSP
jgi:hypothetical protein